MGMKDTHFRDNHLETVKGMAYGYAPSGGTWKQSIPHYDTVGASSLLTTVEDWMKWDRNFDDPKVGGQALVDQMHEPFTLNNGAKTAYLYGLFAGKFRGLRTVSHSGADAGYRSAYVRFPDQKLSVTCLCNAVVNPSQMANEVAALYLEDKMEPKPKPAEEPPAVVLPETELQKAAGVFWNQASQVSIRLVYSKGKLSISMPIQNELTPVVPGLFRSGLNEIRVSTEELSIRSDGQNEPEGFQRVPDWKLSTEDFSTLAGSYYSEELDSTYRIEVRDNKLKLLRKKAMVHDIEPAFKDALFISRLGLAQLERDPNGTVTGFRLTLGRIVNLAFRRTR